MRHKLHEHLHLSVMAAALVMGLNRPALAEDFTFKPNAPPEAAATPDFTGLKTLPASREDLVFRGETATRSWPVYLNQSDAGRITGFQLGMLNNVSALPDRSRLKLTINGQSLADVPVTSAEKPSNIIVPIPPGLLVPGYNAVTIGTRLTHRVDCSIKATYELWSLLKPAQTGFVLPQQTPSTIRRIADIAGETLAEDGTARIHLRMGDVTSPAAADRAARFITALVRRAHIERPIVDVGPAPGAGPGLDLVIGRTADLKAAGLGPLAQATRIDDLGIGRDPRTNRLVLTLSAADDAGLDAAVAAFSAPESANGAGSNDAPVGTPAALDLLAQGGSTKIDGATRLTLADLGIGDINFTGRRYVGAFHVTLPDDIYPSRFEKARLYLDGGHADDLDDDAALIVRVNGVVASSISLAPGNPESFQHQALELPLHDFRAGQNDVEIEALTASQVDSGCDVAHLPDAVRFSLAGTSELEFPPFAHLRVVPELAGGMRFAAGQAAQANAKVGEAGPGSAQDAASALNIYLPDGSRAAIGSGLTLAAAVAAFTPNTTGTPGEAVSFHFSPPMGSDAPGIVIAPLDRLPPQLAVPLNRMAKAPADLGLPQSRVKDWSKAGESGAPASLMQQVAGAVRTGLRDWGFDFGPSDGRPQLLPITSQTLIVAAIEPGAAERRLAGMTLPHIIARNDQWVVVTGQSSAITRAGIDHLVVDQYWSKLSGQAVSVDLDMGEIHNLAAAERTYVLPKALVFSDIQPILGGFMSDNIILSAGALLVLLGLLGVSTHVLVRRFGEQ